MALVLKSYVELTYYYKLVHPKHIALIKHSLVYSGKVLKTEMVGPLYVEQNRNIKTKMLLTSILVLLLTSII